jgi:hypothetical protein
LLNNASQSPEELEAGKIKRAKLDLLNVIGWLKIVVPKSVTSSSADLGQLGRGPWANLPLEEGFFQVHPLHTRQSIEDEASNNSCCSN